MELQGAWNLGGIKMFSCMMAGIVSVCILVLVVEVVLVIVLEWMVLSV